MAPDELHDLARRAVLDIGAGTAEPADILIEATRSARSDRPAWPRRRAPREISAARRLIHPGLVNAHTHSHGNLAKGMGDRWTLELLLTRGAVARRQSRRRGHALSAQIGAVEMMLKGCTACYDLFFEWPAPSREGMALVASAYAEARHARGHRADGRRPHASSRRSPASPRRCRRRCRSGSRRCAWRPARRRWRRSATACGDWPFDRDLVRPAVAPTIPHHCSDEFILGCAALARDFDVGLHSHVAEFEGAGGRRAFASTARRRRRISTRLGVLGPHFTVAHGVWLDDDDMARLGDHGASVAHNPGSNMRLGVGPRRYARRCSTAGSISASAPTAHRAPTTRTCTRRCGSLRSSRRCRGRNASAG